MPRYEITGGNGLGASLDQIREAIKASGGKRISSRHAFGMSNQPKVITFVCDNDLEAKEICKKACEVIWPGNGSIMANLIAYPI